MACNARNLFFAAVVAALSSSLGGEAFVLNGTLIRTVNVTGRLFCSPNGNPILGIQKQPLVGANVTLSCSGNAVLGTAVTRSNGVFNILVTGLNALRFNPSTCMVTARLPVANCSLLPANGVLMSAITTINGIGSTVGGLVTNVRGMVGGVGNVVGGVVSDVGNVVGGAGNTVGSTVGNVIGGVRAVMGSVLNAVPGLFTLVCRAI